MSQTEDFFKIRLNSIHPLSPVTFDVYIPVHQKMVHYLRAGDSLTADKIASFERKFVTSVYVHSSQRQLYRDYVYSQMNSSSLAPQDKASILRESSMAMLEELFESPEVGPALKEAKNVINNFVSFMDQEPEAMGHLISLSGHDFYTYNHSLDVCIYSLGVAQAVGYEGDELKELGEGALLHDIGKRHVSVDIICKDGPLDDMEWAQMQKHPEFGLIILNEHDVSEAIKACCFEHHENFLGNGYPQQLDGEEIHPMARIVALTDTYDALTTKRSYNKPMAPKDAVMFMKEKLFTRYDKDLLEAMHQALFRL